MPFVEWDESLELGDESIDRQHRTLFDLMNRLAEALRPDHGAELVGEAVDLLCRYSLEHFMDEEGAMATSGYPGLEAHKAMHRAFVAKTAQLAGESEYGGVTRQDLLEFLARWLRVHIQAEDVKFIHFVRDGRASGPARA